MKVITKTITYDKQLLEAEHQKNESTIEAIKARIASGMYDNTKKAVPLVKQLQAAH